MAQIVVPQYNEQVQPINPLDAAAKAIGVAGGISNLKSQQQNQALGEITLQQHEQALKDDQDIRAAAQQSGGDPDKIYAILSTSNPRAAAQFGQQLATRRKTEADTLKDSLDNAQKQIGIISSVTQGIKDPNSFNLGRQQLISALGPNAAGILGDTYDENRIKQITDSGVIHKDWLENQQKAIENAREAQRLDMEKGKETRESRQSWEQSLAHAFIGTQSQQDFDNVKGTYSKLGAPADLMALYGEAWSPEVRKKAAAIIGPEAQKVQNEQEVLPTREEAGQQLKDIFGGKLDDPTYKIYAQRLAGMRFTPTSGAALLKEAQQETQGVREAVSKAAAEAPNKIADQKAIANFMTGGDNPMLKDVAPRDREAAKTAYKKAGDALDAARSARDRINTVLSLAKQNNKEAQASAALMGVQALNELANVKRVNGAEIANYGNAGSLIDQIQGELGKLTAGAPIPPQVIDHMQQLHDALFQNAEKAYARSVATVNRSYPGAKFPTNAPEDAGAPAPPQKENPFRPKKSRPQ